MTARAKYLCKHCGAEGDAPAAGRFCAICGVYEAELQGLVTPAAPLPKPDMEAPRISRERSKSGTFRIAAS